MNPSRNRQADFQPARVTLAMLTHLPEEAGYFEHRFEVTRLSLESLLATTPQPFDVMVFDNASSPKMVDYLHSLRDANRIQYLILSSRNIGKVDALQMIFRSAPGEIVAYTDDDVLFQPGWLEAHLKILDTFPKTGMVTGFYIRSQMAFSVKSTLAFAAQPGVETTRGKLIDRKWEQHYIDNMGRTWEKYEEENRGLEDVALCYRGVEALVSAGHHQFVAPRKVIVDALPEVWTGRLMGKMRELDETVDQMGYLRLNTREPVTRLLGNVIGPELAEEAQKIGLKTESVALQPVQAGWQSKFYRMKPVQAAARALYNRMYRIINVK
jgi:glycosyltransferase involved in cell wall biosynthesis